MESYPKSRPAFSLSLVFTLITLYVPICAARQDVGQRYWRLDEMRVVAQSLSKAKTGAVAKWPRMTTPAGSAVLPLPQAAEPITADGKLDEAAWRQATSFPVGPLFADWRQGPFMLQVSACRSEKMLYVAIESPRDLEDLGTLKGGVLFNAHGVACRIDKNSSLPGRAVTTDAGQVIELAVPLTDKKAVLSFYPELVRRADGKLPSEVGRLGLGPKTGSVWLDPITITLVGAQSATRFEWQMETRGKVYLSYWFKDSANEPQKGRFGVDTADGGAVFPYLCKTKLAGKDFHFDGFCYVEPVEQTILAARRMVERSASAGSARILDEIDGLAYKKWACRRDYYCAARSIRARAHLSMLDAPLLFVKRQPYYAGHIYDDYLTWRPGGGIYVIENPSAPFDKRRIRTIIDPTTGQTPGGGVYRDPDLSWDAKKLIFAHKDANNGNTSIYEIGIDGKGLERLTDPESDCQNEPPVRALGAGRHDITPAYLPDGRIVFTSTRPAGRVPCFNSEVDVMHVMNGDGSDVHTISVNNVNEFDPSVLADGRILYGRWEYVDKTALYMQSLWTMSPDGTNETALFANNAAKPTAVLDARAVPGTSLVAASLTPHNGQAVGAIAIIDPRISKNDLSAATSFTPEYPTKMDQGLRDGPCDPWPLSADDILFCNNAIGGHGIIEMVDREGNRELVYADEKISCFAPMLAKPRVRPAVRSRQRHPRRGQVVEPGVSGELAGRLCHQEYLRRRARP